MSGDTTYSRSDEDIPQESTEAGANIEAQLELLAEENRRLREQSRRLRQLQYRRMAYGFGALGLTAVIGAILFPPVREILLALAGIGLFSAILLYFLTPERFLAASIGESVYTSHTRSITELVAELGLKEIQVYVPIRSGETRLFIPQHAEYRVPSEADLGSVLVVPDDDRQRGISLFPTGNELFDEFERAFSRGLATEPNELGRQLTDALVEAFELVEGANASQVSTVEDQSEDLFPEADNEVVEQITVSVTGSVYGDGSAIDHPVTSVIACGLAQQLDTPVIADTVIRSDSEDEYFTTFQWQPSRGERSSRGGDPPET